ncbi:7231_t:CDS:2, partial [Racocetra persica]
TTRPYFDLNRYLEFYSKIKNGLVFTLTTANRLLKVTWEFLENGIEHIMNRLEEDSAINVT